MYLTTFKLKEAPFQPNPDPRFLYLSPAHARAKAYLESVVSTADDFVVITGELGSGKTTLLDTFRRELEKGVVVAHLTHAPISTSEFLQAMLEQFGYLPFRGNKAALLTTLNGYLAEQRAAGRKVLLLLDEAHNLVPTVLEQLRALLDAESDAPSPLSVILVGLPELNEHLDAPELTQLAQRARLRFHLAALTPDQTHGYIVHRLAIAGSQGREIFRPGCFEVIACYAGGAPRLINALCDAGMHIAATAGRDHVLPEDIEAAARDRQLPALAARPVTADPGPAAEPAPPPAPRTDAPRSSIKKPFEKESAGAPVARLRLISGGEVIAEHQVHTGRMMIGRAQDADLRIDDRTISRHHCQIISNTFISVIQDLNSTNGLYVKNERVRRHTLSDGDVVVLGSFQIDYRDERPADAAGDDAGLQAAPPPRPRESDGETTQN
jgi:general secretion pathway protein A